MALFRNLGVKLRVLLCDVLTYVSAQSLVFLDLAENFSFMNWKPTVPTSTLMDGHQIISGLSPVDIILKQGCIRTC
jgi:hypothetical protein